MRLAARIAARSVVALLAIALASCGLTLQGRASAPTAFSSAYVDAKDTQSEFVQALLRALEVNGVRVEPNRSSAQAVIRIEADSVTESVLSVSAQNIPREFEITYLVRFSVEQGGAQTLTSQEVRQTRDFTFDETALLAKERERRILEGALAKDIAAIVMRQLAAL